MTEAPMCCSPHHAQANLCPLSWEPGAVPGPGHTEKRHCPRPQRVHSLVRFSATNPKLHRSKTTCGERRWGGGGGTWRGRRLAGGRGSWERPRGGGGIGPGAQGSNVPPWRRTEPSEAEAGLPGGRARHRRDEGCRGGGARRTVRWEISRGRSSLRSGIFCAKNDASL